MKRVGLQLRLPPDLHARLVENAKASGRSLNAEICAQLEAERLEDRLARIERDLKRMSFNPDEPTGVTFYSPWAGCGAVSGPKP